MKKHERIRFIEPAGVMATAYKHRGSDVTRKALTVDASRPTIKAVTSRSTLQERKELQVEGFNPHEVRQPLTGLITTREGQVRSFGSAERLAQSG
jgi:hypothetical protein